MGTAALPRLGLHFLPKSLGIRFSPHGSAHIAPSFPSLLAQTVPKARHLVQLISNQDANTRPPEQPRGCRKELCLPLVLSLFFLSF